MLINVREYRRGNQKREIKINWQHRVHKTKHYTQTNTNHKELRTYVLCVYCTFLAIVLVNSRYNLIIFSVYMCCPYEGGLPIKLA